MIYSQGSNVFPASGRSGIGTVTPQKALEIRSHADIDYDPAIRLSSDSVEGLQSQTAHWYLATPANLLFFPYSSPRLQVGDVVLQADTTAHDLILAARRLDGKIRLYFDPWGGQWFVFQRGGMGIWTREPVAPLDVGASWERTRTTIYPRMLYLNGGWYDGADRNFVGQYPTVQIGVGQEGCVWRIDHNIQDSGVVFTTDIRGISLSSSGNVAIGGWPQDEARLQINMPSRSDTSRLIAIQIKDANGNEQFRISDDGYVLCRELKVAIPASADWDWPDYVFSEDYVLEDWRKLKAFIQENKHLPGIPSAQKVVQEGGIEVGKLQVLLLEKLEQLFLYVIKLAEENEMLKAEIQALKNKQKKGK